MHEVFDALQFRVLRDRLFETLEGDVGSTGDQITAEVVELTPQSLTTWLESSGNEPLGVAFAGSWGSGTGELHAVALASADSVVWLDIASRSEKELTPLAQWLADPLQGKYLHDAKGPMLALAARGWQLRGLVVDTALAAYLALPGQRSFSLVDLVARFLGRELTTVESDQQQLTLAPADFGGAEQLGIDAAAVRELAGALTKQLSERDGLALLTEVEQPLATVLAKMEEVGIAVDLDQLRTLEQDFLDQVRAAESEAHALAGREFNLGSPKQLQEVLFVERGLPKTKKIKTGYTTDADALQTLFAKTSDPLLEWLLRWRDVSRLRQTVTGLIPLADQESRIHTTFNQTVAATGRLTSQDPNLQNIPIRTDAGRQIRACFVVGNDYQWLLTADYAQIEMRIMAHLSRDKGLIESFRSGEDLHTTMAAQVFDRSPEDIDAELRRQIKAMSYGLAYGLSAYGLSMQLGIDAGAAKDLMADYFERFGGIRDYLAEVVDQARVTGYTETLLGRRRYLPDLNSDNRQRREMAERMALNAPIQGSAADIIKVAMLRVSEQLTDQGLRSRMLLQVHDELVVEVAEGERDQVVELVSNCMAGAVPLSVPLSVSTGLGSNWDSAAH